MAKYTESPQMPEIKMSTEQDRERKKFHFRQKFNFILQPQIMSWRYLPGGGGCMQVALCRHIHIFG
jgi:hypothetical protein